MFKIIVLLLLGVLASATLEVYSPQCAKKLFNGEIKYLLSNFGQIPYGQSIVGNIVVPKDQELCDTKEETMINNQDPTIQNILLVKRGTCKFTKKVINAQEIGADLIIIYDHNPGSVPAVIMKNDGHGHLAQIPSLFISNDDGKKLIAVENDCGDLPMVRVHFDMDQAETSKIIFWLDANNTYILARDFHKKSYYDVLKDRINMTIGFKVEQSCDAKFCQKDDCIGTIKGRFCRNVLKNENPDVNQATGKALLQEQMRQYFLWEEIEDKQMEKELWWKYMHKFDNNICIEEKDVADCSYNTMKDINIPEQTLEQIKTNIKQTQQNVLDQKSSILKTTSQQARQMGIFFYPEVTINGRNFYGLFKAPEVFQAICDSLIDPPKQCISFIRQNHQDYFTDGTGNLWGTVLLILLVMTVVFLVALFIYTKVIRREMNQQLSVEVNKMVQKYVNLAGKDKGNSSASSYSKFDG